MNMQLKYWLLGTIAMLVAGAVRSEVPAAPALAKEVDDAGHPLPFGREPRLAPSTPLGSGPRKAVMASNRSLPEHVLYYPADFRHGKKLAFVAWGNGACINAGNRFRSFLTEIASHGYLVAAAGVMADPKLEVGPQENPRVPKPGEPAFVRPPAPAGGQTTSRQLTESIDWASRVNADPSSPFHGRIDLSKIAVMGQSCGGMRTLEIAGDPRIKTLMIWNSGAGIVPDDPPNPQQELDSVHTSIAFIHGDQVDDIAYAAAVSNAHGLANVPVFEGWQDGMTHIGTYGMKDGGYFGKIAVAWLEWQLKGDRQAAQMFKGADRTLCAAPSWHVYKKGID